MIISFPADVKAPVMPVESPTVPSAEAASKNISDIVKPFPRSVIDKESAPTKRTVTNRTITVIALPTIATRMDLLNISTSFRFLKAAKIVISRTANVTVFIPPAVEPGEPPMNISMIRITLLGSDIAEIFTVLNPAVLAVID
jgi:hypothetical protein